MTDEEKDRIIRAEEIQLYTENRCNSLEERIADLEKENEELEAQIKELQFNLKSRNDLIEELTMQIEKMKCCEEWELDK